ncbi:MAG: PTS glucitol/sorbitol transporter subunit IIA [Clostridia bacterium]
MKKICEMTITGQGSGALDFWDDKLLMLFGDSAGNGVEEYSVRVTMPIVSRDIIFGDKLCFGASEYSVTAIGAEAMQTLRLLGHCTLRFDGSSIAALPGSIHLEDAAMPEIRIGDEIYFF